MLSGAHATIIDDNNIAIEVEIWNTQNLLWYPLAFWIESGLQSR